MAKKKKEKRPINPLEPLNLPDYTPPVAKDAPPDGIKYGDIIGELRIPLRVGTLPNMRSGFMTMKLADTMVTLAEDDGTEVMLFGGLMSGGYEFDVHQLGPDGKDYATFYMAMADIVKAFDVQRLAFMKQHPELVPTMYREELKDAGTDIRQPESGAQSDQQRGAGEAG